MFWWRRYDKPKEIVSKRDKQTDKTLSHHLQTHVNLGMDQSDPPPSQIAPLHIPPPSDPLPPSPSSRSSHTIKKLISMLGETRRRAEEQNSLLKRELQSQVERNEEMRGRVEELELVIDQQRIENSKKWRIEERDDWKALVKSLEGDRRRLEDEIESLRDRLEQGGGASKRRESDADRIAVSPIKIPAAEIVVKKPTTTTTTTPKRKRGVIGFLAGTIGDHLWADDEKGGGEITDDDDSVTTRNSDEMYIASGF